MRRSRGETQTRNRGPHLAHYPLPHSRYVGLYDATSYMWPHSGEPPLVSLIKCSGDPRRRSNRDPGNSFKSEPRARYHQGGELRIAVSLCVYSRWSPDTSCPSIGPSPSFTGYLSPGEASSFAHYELHRDIHVHAVCQYMLRHVSASRSGRIVAFLLPSVICYNSMLLYVSGRLLSLTAGFLLRSVADYHLPRRPIRSDCRIGYYS